MRKKTFLSLVILSFCLTLLIGCSNSKVDETQETETIIKEFTDNGIIIKSIDIKSITSKSLLDAFKEKERKEDIFCFTVTDSTDASKTMEYILFNGVNNGFKDFDFAFEKNILKIKCAVDPNSEVKQKIYIIERPTNSSLDSIEISLTKEDGTVTIYEF